MFDSCLRSSSKVLMRRKANNKQSINPAANTKYNKKSILWIHIDLKFYVFTGLACPNGWMNLH